MDRYRPAVRADLLQVYGVDLADWWQRGRWRALLELIDGLSEASRLVEAQVMDRNNCDQLEAVADEAAEWTPAQRHWTVEAEILAQIRDLIPDVTRAVLATAPRKRGKKAPQYPVPRFPRPRTALEEFKTKRMHEAGDELAAMLGI